MLTHIKIRLGRIIGLKELFYVLSRERAALSATKVGSFFRTGIIAYLAKARQ